MMTQAKETMQAISEEIKTKQEAAHHEMESLIDCKLQSLTSLPAFATLEANQQSQIKAMFEALRTSIMNERYIGNVLAKESDVTKAYDRCLESINQWIDQKQKEEEERIRREKESKGGESTPAPTPKKVVRKVVNKQKAMSVKFDKQMLETKDDVEEYISALRSQLLEYIDHDNNIMLN